MRQLIFIIRDKWCYGIATLVFLAAIILLVSGREHLGMSLSGVVVPFVLTYAIARGHAPLFSRHKDSDEKNDHVV